jgi:hypothetical protein
MAYEFAAVMLADAVEQLPDEQHLMTLELKQSDVSPGDRVSGRLQLEINYELPARGVRVMLIGYETAYHSTGVDGRFNDVYSETRAIVAETYVRIANERIANDGRNTTR